MSMQDLIKFIDYNKGTLLLSIMVPFYQACLELLFS